jgi:hypothetical protein
MNDLQLREAISTVIDRLAPIVAASIDSAIFQPLGEELAGCIVTLDECKYALTGRIAATDRHPSRRVRIIDDATLDTVTLEDGKERPMLQVVKPDWLYDENGARRGD